MATTSPRISDDAVKAKTGKAWPQWFKILDAGGARNMTHQEIVAYLKQKYGIGPWWQQMVTVAYEQARGLRKKHEKPEGYQVSVSRTIAAPVGKVFKAWTDEKTRAKWLPSNVEIRKATTNKSLRITWGDGKTSVEVNIYPQGAGKCQVVAQHSKLPNLKVAAKMKKLWAGSLDRLKETLQ